MIDLQPSTRKWNNQRWIGVRAERLKFQADVVHFKASQVFPSARCVFESFPVVLHSGIQVYRQHVIWVPEEEYQSYQTQPEAPEPSSAPEKPSQIPPKPAQTAPQPAKTHRKPALDFTDMLSKPIVDGNGRVYNAPEPALPSFFDIEITDADIAAFRAFAKESTPAETQPATSAEPVMHQARGTGHKGIYREDYDRLKRHGYKVDVSWNGERFQRWFADTTHGGQLGAFDAALAARNEWEKRVKKPRTEVYITGRTLTGGVTRTKYAFVAQWHDSEGNRCRVCYLIREYGVAKARQLAKAARLRGIKQLMRSKPGKLY